MIKEISAEAMTSWHWTSQDLEILPDDGNRYEIIDGDLHISERPNIEHQLICTRVWELLQLWSRQTKSGIAIAAPGVIFADDDDVAPDVVWISRERYTLARQPDGKLHSAPELMVEVLSPGKTNERRDREFKLWLYSRRGVLEYWIVSRIEQQLELYRRDEAMLKLHSTLYKADLLRSPHLPGFSCQVSQFFEDIL